jgi:hypothetical protein
MGTSDIHFPSFFSSKSVLKSRTLFRSKRRAQLIDLKEKVDKLLQSLAFWNRCHQEKLNEV